VDPESPAQLDAFLTLKRETRVRDLLRSARGAGWFNWASSLAQCAAILVWILLFALDTSTVLIAIVVVGGIWGTEQALGRRINALADLFELHYFNARGDAGIGSSKTTGAGGPGTASNRGTAA